MTLPLRILRSDNGGADFRTQTRDVSYRGLYFLADSRLDVGSEIEFVLTLPEQVTQSGDVNIRCRGSVVRVETTGERMGVAAKINRYEFLSAAAA
jgi:hypothetical protein